MLNYIGSYQLTATVSGNVSSYVNVGNNAESAGMPTWVMMP